MEVDKVVDEVFGLYEELGEGNYIGEAVSQIEHALQAAHQAEVEGFPVQVILGAFFHDVGHLFGQKQGRSHMKTDGVILGIVDHERVGEEYLKGLGFSNDVTRFVRNHVQAKRYLVTTDASYYKTLSDASKGTLKHQGGPMSQEEVQKFKEDPQFKATLRMREWDDKAKDPNAVTPNLDHYRNMCREFLRQCAGEKS